ncbi:MAG: pentapeptide repeat-containing protein [Methanobacterium sp.]
MKTYTKEEIANILDLHAKWLNGVDGGVKADLSYSNLRGADLSYSNLRGADLRGANLRGADLRGADLSDSNLSDSNLSGSNLRGTNLRGSDLSYSKTDKRYIQISCIGSKKRTTIYCFEDNIIWCGCFCGTLEEFENEVKNTHAENKQYLAEYLGFINYIKSLINVEQ